MVDVNKASVMGAMLRERDPSLAVQKCMVRLRGKLNACMYEWQHSCRELLKCSQSCPILRSFILIAHRIPPSNTPSLLKAQSKRRIPKHFSFGQLSRFWSHIVFSSFSLKKYFVDLGKARLKYF